MITRTITEIGNLQLELVDGKTTLTVTGCAGPAAYTLNREDAIDLINTLRHQLNIPLRDLGKDIASE